MNKIFIIVLVLCLGLVISLREHFIPQEQENFEGIKVLRNLNKKLENIHKKNINKFTLQDDPKKKNIKDNTIVVTGATSGLGLELVKMLNKYKPRLVVCGKKQNKVEKLVEELKKSNKEIYGIWQDMSTPEGPGIVFKKIKDYVHHVDILVNNCIIKKGSDFLLSKNESDWIQEFSINVNANIILSKKIAHRMKIYGVKGRIINLSTDAVKSDSDSYSSSEIITTSVIEKFSNLMAKELFKYNIASTIIRIDNDINRDKQDDESILGGIFQKIYGISPKKIMPVFMYVIKAPLQEISGKIISTNSYLQNPDISKIVASNPMKLNDSTKDYEFTKHKKDKSYTYLVKQNPYKPSNKVNSALKLDKFNNINDVSKYKSKLQKIIAKNLNIHKDNIVFFKDEYESIKKIVNTFVPKNNEIITLEPTWNYLKLLKTENNISLVYSSFIAEDKKLKPNFDMIYSLINTNTKLIYLSSPNIVSGQSIDVKDFEDFIKEIPNNIIILLDQRYIEFSSKTNILDGSKFIEKYKNLIVLRTFNNYYSIETLQLSYILTNKELAAFISETVILNQIDRFSENLALSVYNNKYYDKIKKKIINEKNRVTQKLKEYDIEYFDTETNFLLIKTNKSKDEISDELEKKKILLYTSDDYYDYYWCLPLSNPTINDKILNVLMYSDIN